jgi:hypothetical protein
MRAIGELVGEREIDAVRLRAVAQRGVEQIKALAGHDAISPKVIIGRQRDRDQDGDQRNRDMMRPQAEELSSRNLLSRYGSARIKPIGGVKRDGGAARSPRI